MYEDYWSAAKKELWTGRDDSQESQNAKRIFQSVTLPDGIDFASLKDKIALTGFKCDEGVKLNKGRTGASAAPDELRRAFANMAAYTPHERIVDIGDISYKGGDLESTQLALAGFVEGALKAGAKSLVIGGGHETAYGHGLAVYRSFPGKKIGIINFDAHLDLRTAKNGNSGTPFKQLADYATANGFSFNYLCAGVSKAANTQALFDTAEQLGVRIIYDEDCYTTNLKSLEEQLKGFIGAVDVIYFTTDLDVLPLSYMFAVSAPAALGVTPATLIKMAKTVLRSGKVQAVDLVEYAPSYDDAGLSARVASRLIWQYCNDWI